MTLERHIFELIGEPPLQLPMVTPAQQLAEKLHALVRTYDGEQPGKGSIDMLVIADLVRLPSAVRWPKPLGRHSAYAPSPGHRVSPTRPKTGPSPGRDTSGSTRRDEPTSPRPSLLCASSGSHCSRSPPLTRTGTQRSGDGSDTRSRLTKPPRSHSNLGLVITRASGQGSLHLRWQEPDSQFLTFRAVFAGDAIDMGLKPD